MKCPLTPPEEAARLDSLRRLNLLDTPAEPRFDRITRMARRLLGTKIALISLVDADRQWFKSAQGLDAPQTGRDISFCGHAILGEAPLVVPNALEDPRFSDNPLVTGDPNIRLYAGHPLHAPDGYRIGTLCVIDPQPRHLDSDDLEALRDLAETAEKEIANEVLSASERALRAELAAANERAAIDPLTRLWNRGAIIDLLQRELERAARARQTVAALMVDLDHFKAVNDELGHPAGDAVLLEASRRMQSNLRAYDAIGRYGGEEFLVVLSDCTEACAAEIAERLRAGLASEPVDLPSGPRDISASFGLWWGSPAGQHAIDEVIIAADAALYRAKGDGRNRVAQSPATEFTGDLCSA